METTTINPSFVKFIDEVMEKLNSSVDTKNYFSLTESKKKVVDGIIYQSIIRSFSYNVVLTEDEAKETFNKFRIVSVSQEDYVMAGIFKNIILNVDTHINKPKTRRRSLTKKNPEA